MWLSSRLWRTGFLLLALAMPLALSACTGFSPLYGPGGVGNNLPLLSFAEPGSRLEQIVYEELALRLGKSADPKAHRLTIKLTKKAVNLTSGDVTSPVRQKEVTVTAAISIDEIVAAASATAPASTNNLFTATRSASADYTIGAQALASQQAETDASERAARALADTIRLTLIAELSRPASTAAQ